MNFLVPIHQKSALCHGTTSLANIWIQLDLVNQVIKNLFELESVWGDKIEIRLLGWTEFNTCIKYELQRNVIVQLQIQVHFVWQLSLSHQLIRKSTACHYPRRIVFLFIYWKHHVIDEKSKLEKEKKWIQLD
jgi:hypothetical protein